jgi:hypothetical protein
VEPKRLGHHRAASCARLIYQASLSGLGRVDRPQRELSRGLTGRSNLESWASSLGNPYP